MLAWSIHWWENALHWGWFHGCWPSEYKIFLYWCTGKCIFMQNANAQIWPSVSLMLCLPYCVPLNVSSAVLFVCFISLFAETFVICGGPWRQILFFSYCFPSMCLAFSQAVQQSGLFPIRKNRKLLQETCAHMPLHTIELTSQSHGSNSASEWGGQGELKWLWMCWTWLLMADRPLDWVFLKLLLIYWGLHDIATISWVYRERSQE